MTDLSIYFPMIVLVGMLMLLILLLTYMASRLLKVPEWEAYLNIELSELLLSFLLLLSVVGTYEVMNTVAAAVTGQPSVTQASILFLNEVRTDAVLPGIVDVFRLQTCLSILNMFQRRLGEYVLTITYKLFPGLDSLLSILNVIGFGLATIYGSISFQLMMLQFIEFGMINLILPAGIILRFFPPTRESGAFLIALALGFGVVFPTTYVINASVMKDLHIQVYDPPTFTRWWMCGAKYPIAGAVGSLFIERSFTRGPVGSLVKTVFVTAASEAGLNLISPFEFFSFIRNLAALSLPGLFFPALSTMITIAFINATTKFILFKM